MHSCKIKISYVRTGHQLAKGMQERKFMQGRFKALYQKIEALKGAVK